MLQAIYEPVDSGNAGTRIFFADISKGFDLIDHNILMDKLTQLEASPALLSWIAGFLSDRQQAVKIGDKISNWLPLKGGIPQGTRLGVVLFTVMTNRLLLDWHLRIKFVEDSTALEIIPRNSLSYLNTAVSDTHRFEMAHRMRFNPKKCKERLINFMIKPNFTIRPINLGDNAIERVPKYKILGVHLQEDFKWDIHVNYMHKKACKKLYSLYPESVYDNY